jgi:hypothetical protein
MFDRLQLVQKREAGVTANVLLSLIDRLKNDAPSVLGCLTSWPILSLEKHYGMQRMLYVYAPFNEPPKTVQTTFTTPLKMACHYGPISFKHTFWDIAEGKNLPAEMKIGCAALP